MSKFQQQKCFRNHHAETMFKYPDCKTRVKIKLLMVFHKIWEKFNYPRCAPKIGRKKSKVFTQCVKCNKDPNQIFKILKNIQTLWKKVICYLTPSQA